MTATPLTYRLLGNVAHTLELDLAPEQSVIAETGAMRYRTAGIAFTAGIAQAARSAQGEVRAGGR